MTAQARSKGIQQGDAAVAIQSVIRGSQQQKQRSQQVGAAASIQAFLRGSQQRKELSQQAEAAASIQALARGSQQRNKLAQQADATASIQGVMREPIERKADAEDDPSKYAEAAVAAAVAGAAVAATAATAAAPAVVEAAVPQESPAEYNVNTSGEASLSLALGSSDEDFVTVPESTPTSSDSSDIEEGHVDNVDSISDASSIDLESEIAQAFDLGQEALRSAPDNEEYVAPLPPPAHEAEVVIDEANVNKARHFLSHPSTAALPLEDKKEYLRSKGLADVEIEASLDAVAALDAAADELMMEEGMIKTSASSTTETASGARIAPNPGGADSDIEQGTAKKDAVDTSSSASTAEQKSALGIPSGGDIDDSFNSRASKSSARNTSRISERLNQSLARIREMEVPLPSCKCLPSHVPNRVVYGLVLLMILLGVALYLIYVFAVGN